jgi:7,8-dihydropterin-6-yl-methyl-4-(beta-D-ribofuranosyl)aminobenzene 5'-phosphate synthase
MSGARTGGQLALAGMAAAAVRYAAARSSADRAWARQVEPRLTQLGEVDQVTILPVVERLTREGPLSDRLRGEPGVSYLVRAGGTTLLFDTGFNMRGRSWPPLLHNAAVLGVDLRTVDGVVISHLHPDHDGGSGMVRRRTFAFSPDPVETRGVPAYVPTRMHHDRADVTTTTGPRVIAPGVAVLPPLPSALFLLGPVHEQAMVVNVCGFGLVVVTGCGHPPIERILGVTEMVLDVPVRAVVGGLHLPVHPLGTPLVPQAVLGNRNWPWHPIGERDAAHVIDEVRRRGPWVVALSPHDSTPWTCDAFARAFGDRYRTLRAGEELRISAQDASGRAGWPSSPP